MGMEYFGIQMGILTKVNFKMGNLMELEFITFHKEQNIMDSFKKDKYRGLA